MIKGLLRSQSNFHLKKIEEYFKDNYGIDIKEIKEIYNERRNHIMSNKLYEGKCFLQYGVYKTKLIYILKYHDKTNEFEILITEVDITGHSKSIQYDKEMLVPTDYILNLFVEDLDGIKVTEEISTEKYDDIKKVIKKMYNNVYIPDVK